MGKRGPVLSGPDINRSAAYRYADVLSCRRRSVPDCGEGYARRRYGERGTAAVTPAAPASASAGGEQHGKGETQRFCAATGATDHAASLLPWRRMQSIRRQAPFMFDVY